jgi:hypothetical protein
LKNISRTCRELLNDPVAFSWRAGHVQLRTYQSPVIKAIVDSVRNKSGLSFVIIFSRQSGKNETQLALYTYLLTLFQRIGGDIIHVEPTFKPQTQTAMVRLEHRLNTNVLTIGKWRKKFGYVYSVGLARVVHLSGDESANVIGQTASLLLSVNEAQDIGLTKFDKEFNPMAASTNATRVFWGTEWTSNTLLAREEDAARQLQIKDGIQRVFFITADDVSAVLPAYRVFVENEIKIRGREHPLVKTQYFNERIDAQTGMFPPARQMLMLGSHNAQTTPLPGQMIAFLIDVAGQDEAVLDPNQLDNPARDFTSLKIIEIDPCTIPEFHLPTYRVLNRLSWHGQKHTTLHAQIKALAEIWNPRYIVIDATGVGEGLWSLLDLSFPDRCRPVKFTQTEKSTIGYQFISIVETGRYKEYSPMSIGFIQQCSKCRSEVQPGPLKTLKWGVPEHLRDETGQFIHDDDLVSSALCSILDREEWSIHSETTVIDNLDPLKIDRNY